MAVLVLLFAAAACDGEVARAIDAGKDLVRSDQTTTDLGSIDGGVTDGPATDLDGGAADKGTDAAGPPCNQSMDASGVGPCDMHLGTKWNGTACVNVSGCSCTGSDCGNLFAGVADCEQAYAHCLCAPMDAKSGDPSCPAILGVAWDGKQCDYIGGCSCQGTDCDKLFSTMGECKQAYLHCTSGP